MLGLRFFARAFSLVMASGGHSSLRCVGLSLSRPLLLQSTGSRCAGSVIVAHGPSCSVACGIFPDQGSNPCPLHWQADSQPLRHQGSPILVFFKMFFWFFGHEACGILATRPGIEPTPPALEGKVLTTGLPGKSWINNFDGTNKKVTLERILVDWSLTWNTYLSKDYDEKKVQTNNDISSL